ncbi:hypothetical protein [Novosphingobium pentaromativorans]|uniref:Uncharacterized protein n=1 Tax=Novosphingobium pentaromativorans US6-1 TaxID=1088721 RepID=G6EHR7_9SPHN|nr:hypothetical protein [Novosphingobium pentaromativorans]AIT78561.1 hypothetical protein JI59_01400 [Novosphingobium pentaromativorans US6-1]EHJ59051.1 hypothetical protein NSU_3888 [Novosphingobium pentaromativorans US6-1]
MNLATAMLYPIMVLLPAVGLVDGERSKDKGAFDAAWLSDEDGSAVYSWRETDAPGADDEPQAALSAWPFTVSAFQRVEPPDAWQVRIEQRMTIRITPRSPRTAPPDMFVGLPDGEIGSHFSERKIGKCLSIAGIVGVQPDGDNRLLLFMRDRRLVSAELERACRARDFYSGFYLSHTSDGQLCIDRDTLLSRSGMNCKLTRIRQLVEVDH